MPVLIHYLHLDNLYLCLSVYHTSHVSLVRSLDTGQSDGGQQCEGGKKGIK